MARMLGSQARPWCPQCRNPRGIGLDCPDVSRSKRQWKRAEERAWRRDWADEGYDFGSSTKNAASASGLSVPT